MAKAVQWLLCTYLALKFVQFFFVARPGFGRPEPGFGQKLLRGEPVVFLVACVSSVPAAIWSTQYFQNGFERGLERSVDCYGRASAVEHLGAAARRFDSLRVFKFSKLAKRSALNAAQALTPARADAEKLMADRLSFYTQRYSTLRRRGDERGIRAQTTAIRRCMSEPLINF